MKLGCLPVTYFADIREGKMSVQQWLTFAKSLGLDGTECSLAFVDPLGPVPVPEFKQMVDQTGLLVSTVTCHPDFCHPDADERERQFEDMSRNVRVASFLGAPLARVLAGQQHPGVDREQGIRWVVDGLKRVMDVATPLGVTLALENHTKSFFWTHYDFAMRSDVFLEIGRRLRGTALRVQFDTANPIVCRYDGLAVLDEVADLVVCIHTNDADTPGEFKFVPVGTGTAPIVETFRRLRGRGYDGWVSIEEASRTGEAGFRQAVSFVRKAWSEAAP